MLYVNNISLMQLKLNYFIKYTKGKNNDHNNKINI